MIFLGRPHPAHAGYANAKLAMLEAYQESYGLKWAYIVSANLFGPRDKFDAETGNVVPSLIKKFHDAKKSGTTVTVWGDGSAQRDFVYIKDAARIGLGIMNGVDGPVNMGSGQVYRIRDVVDALADIAGMNGRIEWDHSKPERKGYRAPDLSTIGGLGLRPAYSIRAGSRRRGIGIVPTMASVSSRYDAASSSWAEHRIMNDSVGGAEADSWANHGK
jgi:GDP-L-fucose synthase